MPSLVNDIQASKDKIQGTAETFMHELRLKILRLQSDIQQNALMEVWRGEDNKIEILWSIPIMHFICSNIPLIRFLSFYAKKYTVYMFMHLKYKKTPIQCNWFDAVFSCSRYVGLSMKSSVSNKVMDATLHKIYNNQRGLGSVNKLRKAVKSQTNERSFCWGRAVKTFPRERALVGGIDKQFQPVLFYISEYSIDNNDIRIFWVGDIKTDAERTNIFIHAVLNILNNCIIWYAWWYLFISFDEMLHNEQ